MKLLAYLIPSFISGVVAGFFFFCPKSSDAKKFVRNLTTDINNIEVDDNDRCDIH